MPATAPWKLKRLQNRLSRMEGPNAAPNTPHALETSPMMEPALGFVAMSNAASATISTIRRPFHMSSLSLAWFLRRMDLYTSLENADDAASSWLSAVLIAAARTADSNIPEMRPGNMLRTISTNTNSLALMPSSKPRQRRPTMPMIAANATMITVQLMPINADFFISFCERMDM